jgi:hypothetical protein
VVQTNSDTCMAFILAAVLIKLCECGINSGRTADAADCCGP